MIAAEVSYLPRRRGAGAVDEVKFCRRSASNNSAMTEPNPRTNKEVIENGLRG